MIEVRDATAEDAETIASSGRAGLGMRPLAGSTQPYRVYAPWTAARSPPQTDLSDDMPIPGVGFGWRLHQRATASKE
jgi:hypothetical protein